MFSKLLDIEPSEFTYITFSPYIFRISKQCQWLHKRFSVGLIKLKSRSLSKFAVKLYKKIYKTIILIIA